jgi:hypothetical protein
MFSFSKFSSVTTKLLKINSGISHKQISFRGQNGKKSRHDKFPRAQNLRGTGEIRQQLRDSYANFSVK